MLIFQTYNTGPVKKKNCNIGRKVFLSLHTIILGDIIVSGKILGQIILISQNYSIGREPIFFSPHNYIGCLCVIYKARFCNYLYYIIFYFKSRN